VPLAVAGSLTPGRSVLPSVRGLLLVVPAAGSTLASELGLLGARYGQTLSGAGRGKTTPGRSVLTLVRGLLLVVPAVGSPTPAGSILASELGLLKARHGQTLSGAGRGQTTPGRSVLTLVRGLLLVVPAVGFSTPGRSKLTSALGLLLLLVSA